MNSTRQQVQLNNGNQGFRALMSAEIRVLSESDGEVQYIASDETIDSYKEVIRADGWRFDLFKKNAPFVDSHDYSSIGKLLGNVINWQIDRKGRRLIETVRWAKDVAGNTAAQLGWAMLTAGFGPKAVSVGFMPEEWVSKFEVDKRPMWQQQLAQTGLDEKSGVVRIFIKHQQIELSACILGANPNAIQASQKALAAGVISKREFNFLRSGNTSPQFQVPFESKPNTQKSMNSRLQRISGLFGDQGDSSSATPNPASAHGEPAPQTSGRALSFGLTGELLPLRTLCEIHLQQHPDQRRWLRAAAQVLCRTSRSQWDADAIEFDERLKTRSLTTGDSSLGQAVAVIESLSSSMLDFMLLYGAFRTLGVVPMDAGKKKIASLTGRANAYWIKPSNQGTAPPVTESLGGKSISPEVSTLATLIEVSAESLNDGKTTFEGALLTALVEGLAYQLDWTCFQGNGADDFTSGGMTGIFVDAEISSISASASHTAIAQLDGDDFASLIGDVDQSALAHPCRFWISPAFLPDLLKVREVGADTASARLLKPPTSAGDEWRIHGFPVSWAAAAPSANNPDAKVAAFGRGDAYSVALRQDFEIASSAATSKWAQNIWQFRALARARCLTRDAASLATLKLAES